MAHILIIDDEPAIRDAVRAILERDGHTLDEEFDARGIEAALARHAADVVIVDMHLPGMDGREAIAALRRDHPAIKILAISGDLVLDEAMRVGADAVLSKPFRGAELRETVQGLLP